MSASTNSNYENPLSLADWRKAGLVFHSLNFFYSKKFGGKTWKLSLDAGCSCPNRDGRLATSGCIFCDPESFSPSRRNRLPSIAQQIEQGIAALKKRYNAQRFIAYFQPGTNTYGNVDKLREAYFQALSHPEVVGLAIGTRPDCVENDVLELLAELTQKTWLIVEFGLQTIHNRILDWLNRGHHFEAFLDAYQRTIARNINVGVHVILGLPGESADDQLATARTLAELKIHAVKLHNLYAVRNTPLAEMVASGKVKLPGFSEYVNRVVDFLEQIPPEVVVERLCGDAPKEYLVGPEWCQNKSMVRQAVETEFRARGTWQGCKSPQKAESL